MIGLLSRVVGDLSSQGSGNRAASAVCWGSAGAPPRRSSL